MNQSQLNNESDCSYLTMNTGIEERYPPTNSFMSIVPTKYKITKKVKKGFPTTSENGRANLLYPQMLLFKNIYN